ncbi:ABC transporter permease [Ligilactobacillus pabuli]|uniref:ABC transporter permease n=1 Tax=Ligilactobacillus pabuli TaxID=2886039 RepID=A0ABQ5JJF1_9LACO|nr:hypothetical protein [Ligilactobacillus pabuli]GKS81983.1 ABC transporter permease [Ligilactobacillus pabuli]
MTDFKQLVRVFLTDKIRIVGSVITVYVAATLLSLVPALFNGPVFDKCWSNLMLLYAAGWGSVAALLAGALLAYSNEKVYRTNRYRLLPVSNGKLYSANLFSSFLAYILVFLAELIFVLIYYLFNIKTVRALIAHSFAGFELRLSLILVFAFLVGLLTMVFWWSIASLVHLLTATITRTLPDKHQLIAQCLIYAALIMAVVRTYFAVKAWWSQLADLPFMVTSVNAYLSPVWAALILLVLTLVLGVINVWLLEHQVETKQ